MDFRRRGMKKNIFKLFIGILLQVCVYIYLGINYGKEPVLLLLCIDFYRNISNDFKFKNKI